MSEPEPTTAAGRSLLRMFRTEEGPRHTRWPRAFDARLTERIVEDFVTRIEQEAVDAALRSDPVRATHFGTWQIETTTDNA